MQMKSNAAARASEPLLCNLLSLLSLCLGVLCFLEASFWVNYRVATACSEYKVGVLFLELGKVLLSIPIPRRVGFE